MVGILSTNPVKIEINSEKYINIGSKIFKCFSFNIGSKMTLPENRRKATELPTEVQ